MIKQKAIGFLINQKMFIILIVLVLFLSLYTEFFLTFENIINIIFQIALNGIIAIGMTYLIISGELDLSVGSSVAFTGVVTVMLLRSELGLLPSILIGMLTGVLIGFVNGVLVIKVKINSIATTLGMMIFLRGLVYLLTGNKNIRGTSETFKLIGSGEIFNIPYVVIIFIFLILVFGFLLANTIYGRNIYAIGGNSQASRLFGINVGKNKLIAFIITGFLASVSGIILASRLNVGSTQVGVDTLIDVLTIVILGGASLAGGEGSMFRTFQAALLIGIISNALQFLNIISHYHPIIKGLLLLGVLIIDAWYVKYRKYRFV
jgi:ribose transport system permease protein